MVNPTEIFRRYNVYGNSVGGDIPMATSSRDCDGLRSGVAKIVSVSLQREYTVTEQMMTASGYADASGAFSLVEVSAQDYQGRKFGYVGKFVKFWQVRDSSSNVMTFIDVSGFADMWTARIINPNYDLPSGHGLYSLPLTVQNRPCGFYVDQIDPCTLESFYPSRTRDENNNYIPAVSHNLAINPTANMNFTALSYWWMPLRRHTVIQVQTVNYPSSMGNPPYLRHLFYYPHVPWLVIVKTDAQYQGTWRSDFEYGLPTDALKIAFSPGMHSNEFNAFYPRPEAGTSTMVMANLSGYYCSTGTGGIYYYEVSPRIPIIGYSTKQGGDADLYVSPDYNYGRIFANT